MIVESFAPTGRWRETAALLAETELTSDVVLILDVALTLESALWRLLTLGLSVDGLPEPADSRPDDRTPRAEARFCGPPFKACSARIEARTSVSRFKGLSLTRKDLRAAASRLKPTASFSAEAVRERVELLVERM